MNDEAPEQPLTFGEVDGLALAQELDHLAPERVVGSWVAQDLGPMIELQSLIIQGRVPLWFLQQHLTLCPRLADLMKRINTRQPFTPLHGSPDCGLFLTDSDSDGTRFTGFRVAAMKAAEAAGFPTADARQLSAAMGELRSNIVEHSGAVATGLLCFAWRDGRFEFGAVDRGVGVLESLRTCEEFANVADHGTALQIATTEGKSRHGEGSGHGNGFRDLFIGLMNHRGDLRFRSGDHALELHGSSPGAATASIIQKANLGGLAITVSCSPG